MNALINACLECAGSPRHKGAHIWLARLAAWARLSDPTLNTIYHYLLAAAEYLAKSAELLLDPHDDDAYLREKLNHGLNRLTSALYEGVRHAHKPERFDFIATYFPTEADR